MKKIKSLTINIGYKLTTTFLSLVVVWIAFALCFQLLFVFLEFSGRQETTSKITNWIICI